MPELKITKAPNVQQPSVASTLSDVGSSISKTVSGFGSGLATAGSNLKDSVSFDKNQQGNIPLGNLLPQVSVNLPSTFPNASIPPINISSILCGKFPPSLGSIAGQMGISVSLPGLGSALGIPSMSTSQALSTLGLPNSLSGISDAVSKAIGQNLAKIPGFPGLDLVGISLGAGPKWLAETLLKYQTLIPPYIPGLKINIGMIVAALTLIKAIANANPSELLKTLLGNIKDDLTCDALEQLTNPQTSEAAKERLKIDLGNLADSLAARASPIPPLPDIEDEEGNIIPQQHTPQSMLSYIQSIPLPQQTIQEATITPSPLSGTSPTVTITQNSPTSQQPEPSPPTSQQIQSTPQGIQPVPVPQPTIVQPRITQGMISTAESVNQSLANRARTLVEPSPSSPTTNTTQSPPRP